jgi:hypothetical protein
MISVKFNLASVKSMKEAEAQKLKLENQGYKLVAEDVGFLTGVLFYKKG